MLRPIRTVQRLYSRLRTRQGRETSTAQAPALFAYARCTGASAASSPWLCTTPRYRQETPIPSLKGSDSETFSYGAAKVACASIKNAPDGKLNVAVVKQVPEVSQLLGGNVGLCNTGAPPTFGLAVTLITVPPGTPVVWSPTVTGPGVDRITSTAPRNPWAALAPTGR